MKPVAEWKLTPREAECLESWISEGCEKRVAERMSISVSTVQAHNTSLRRKSGCRFMIPIAVAWDRTHSRGESA